MDDFSPTETQIIPVALGSGMVIQVEAIGPGEEDIMAELPSFAGVTDAIEEIACAVEATLAKVKPKKAKIELGIDVGIESGHLTALIVKGTGQATIKITLEWERTEDPASQQA
jgi:hypothetical protein